MGRRLPDENVTFRIDPDVLLWARLRALREGTSVNRLVRRFLDAYAEVPDAWREGLPPPWQEDNGRLLLVSGGDRAAHAARAAGVAHAAREDFDDEG